MKSINDTLKILLLAAGIFALAELGLFFGDMRSAAKETTATMAEAKSAVSELRDYSREQLARLRDPRNSKAIDAAIQTAAVFNGTGRLINSQLIPRAMKTLDGLAESTASLNRMIQATDQSFNAEIAPEAVKSLQSADSAIGQLSIALTSDLADIHQLLSDPAWAASLDSIQAATENVSGITSELEKASRQMPEIAESVNKIASTSSRYRRWILLSQIFSAVARAFF